VGLGFVGFGSELVGLEGQGQELVFRVLKLVRFEGISCFGSESLSPPAPFSPAFLVFSV
jgi:hypothetical protein